MHHQNLLRYITILESSYRFTVGQYDVLSYTDIQQLIVPIRKKTLVSHVFTQGTRAYVSFRGSTLVDTQ